MNFSISSFNLARLGCWMANRVVRTGFYLVVALLVMEGFKPLPPLPQLESGADLRRFFTQMTHAKAEYDLLVIGDSRVFRGISPKVLEENLPGIKARNLAYGGGGLQPELLAWAEAMLRPGPGPRLLVFGLSPSILSEKKNQDRTFHTYRDLPLFQRFINLYLSNDLFIPTSIHTLVKRYKEGEGEPQEERYRQHFHENGWIATTPLTTISPPSESQLRQGYGGLYTRERPSGVFQPELAEDLLRWTRRWRQEGRMVLAFQPPTSQAMERVETALSGFDPTDFARRFEAAGGIWLTFSGSDYQTYDGSHLERQSARRFSHHLAGRIRPLLERKR